MIDNLHFVKELGLQSREALEAGNTARLRRADARALGAQEAPLRRHEQSRRSTSGTTSACKNGAVGGKLIGAGGGGFLMFYADDRNRLRHAMATAGLEEVRFRFDFEGTKVLFSLSACCRSPSLPAAWPRGCARSPRRFPRRWSRSRASRSSPASCDYLQRQGVGRVVLCVGYLGEQIEAVVGDGSRFGLRRPVLVRRPDAARNRRRAAAGAAASGRRVLRPLRRFLSCRSTLRPVERAFVASGKPALMTVLQQRRPLGQEQRRVRGRRDRGVQQAAPDGRRWRTSTTALASCRRRRSQTRAPAEPFDLADVYHELSLSGRARRSTRFTSASTRSARTRGSAETADYFRRQGQTNELRASSTCTKRAEIIAELDVGADRDDRGPARAGQGATAAGSSSSASAAAPATARTR